MAQRGESLLTDFPTSGKRYPRSNYIMVDLPAPFFLQALFFRLVL